MLSYARENVRMTKEKNQRQIPMGASHGLKWENKTYKLKRSIQKEFVIWYGLEVVETNRLSLVA